MKDTHMISLRRDLTKWGQFLNVCIPLKSRARLNYWDTLLLSSERWKKKNLFSKGCFALRCDHCLHTKRKGTSEELHAQGSKQPKRAGELPVNHTGVSRSGSAGRRAMLWEEQGRCHGPLCQCDWSQTPLAAFLCESLLSPFPTALLAPRFLLLAFPNQYFCLKKANSLKQTSYLLACQVPN